MGLIRLGQARESLTWTAEEYKGAVRSYLESMGYSQTTDSFVEGLPVDMVFEPVWSQSSRRVWVEAKHEEVSLEDPEFQKQLLGYLERWLELPADRRPEVKLFVRKARSPKKWDALFGVGLDDDAVTKWIAKVVNSQKPELGPAFLSRNSEVKEFFALCEPFQADRETLLLASAEKEETALLGLKRLAERLRNDMTRRCSVEEKPDQLVSNLVAVAVPESYSVIEVDADSEKEAWTKLGRGDFPPFVLTAKGKILTLNLIDVKEAFAAIRAGDPVAFDLERVEQELPAHLMKLLNRCLSSLLQAKGMRLEEHVFHFPAVIKEGVVHERTIPSPSGREVKVADPQTTDHVEGDFMGMKRTRRLNFVFHRGLEAWTKRLWGKYFISLRLHRVYSSDGIHRLDAEAARRIDGSFRNPLFARGEAQLALTRALAEYLFRNLRDWERPPPNWRDRFSFGGQAETRTSWGPVEVPTDQLPLEEFEPEYDGEHRES